MRYDVRPLDWMASVKSKLGLLVAVSIGASSAVAVFGTRLGLPPWATVPGAVLVALGITQVLARGMTSPLREMTAAAQRMARGDYSQRVRATSHDEVGDLARAFNRMAATLELVDQQRRDLVANVSHELRTPISALQAVLENLADGVSRPDTDTLRSALAQTERLGRLVTDLLDLSRVEAGVAPLNVKEIAVRDFLLQAVSQARVDGLHYTVAVDEPGLRVRADPERLHQLMANLLDNASRHSPRAGEVHVSASAGGDGAVLLEVADDGPGIAAADRASVFERFTTSSAQTSGTGLGLAISRWVAQLHGGTIRVADSSSGCRIEVTLPHDPQHRIRNEEPIMRTLTPPAPIPETPASRGGDIVTSYWPDAGRGRPRIVAAAVAVGIFAAAVLPDHDLGLGSFLVFASVVTVVLASRRPRPWTWADAVDIGLVALLLSTMLLRDAEWIVLLCLPSALGLVVLNVTGAKSAVAVVASMAAVPLAGLRGLPWLGRSLRSDDDASQWWPIARTVALSAALLLVFGALFASADAVFARWVDAVTPDITWNDLPSRAVLATFIAAGTLAASFVALAPPLLDRLSLPTRRSARAFEWLAPVLVVNAVFAVFLVAQLAALFGGHEYLRRTTGLTYAEYVHEGFGQLTAATLLTLTVVAWATRRAVPGMARDAALGALCLMTLVVVGSALYRMRVYEEAYGFTQLRLLVSVFEGWLGAIVVFILVAGLIRRSSWLVWVALRTGIAALLGLALINPDLYIARHNIERVDTAVEVDWEYLGLLSGDAYPALMDLPKREFDCATRERGLLEEDEWLGWNLSRERAHALMAERPPAGASGWTAPCSTRP